MGGRAGETAEGRPLPSLGDRTTAAKVVATAATVAAWAAVTALGTVATFGGDTGLPVAEGYVSLGLHDGGGPAGMPLQFSGLVPGGAATQAMTLVNDGDADLAAVLLSTVVLRSSLLDTDATRGLQLSVDSCSVAWTPGWTCPGERSRLLAPGPVSRRAELREPASRAAGASDHLAVTVTLPETAGNEFHALRSELVLTFTGVQDTGMPR